MKKYLLMIAVALMTAITFTACSSDDDDNAEGLAKTTWNCQYQDEIDGTINITVSFKDNSNGILVAAGQFEVAEGVSVPGKMYAQFTYSFANGKGHTVTKAMVMETPVGVVPMEVDEESNLDFSYDGKTLVVGYDEMPVPLKKVGYQDIKFPAIAQK